MEYVIPGRGDADHDIARACPEPRPDRLFVLENLAVDRRQFIDSGERYIRLQCNLLFTTAATVNSSANCRVRRIGQPSEVRK
jgi:hypothetical protein